MFLHSLKMNTIGSLGASDNIESIRTATDDTQDSNKLGDGNICDWSIEQADAWANRESFDEIELPPRTWHEKQVAAWARKKYRISFEQSAKIIENGISGAAIQAMPSLDELKEFFKTGDALILWDHITRLRAKRTANEADLEDRPNVRRFRVVNYVPPTPPGDYAFENREKELVEFIRLSVSNWKEANSLVPNNKKIQLAIASQMLGSGKTWFGYYLLKAAAKNREKLLQKFNQKDLDHFLSAHYFGFNLDRIEGEFSKTNFKSFMLKQFLYQSPESIFHEAQKYWNNVEIETTHVSEIAGWFWEKLGRKPFLFHFDEIDRVNPKKPVEKISFELDPEKIQRYLDFWTLIHPLHQLGFIYCSGRSPHLFYLGKQFQFASPSITKHFFFDRLYKSNIKNLLQKQVEANKLKLEVDIDQVADALFRVTAGVPRFVTWSIDYLKELGVVKTIDHASLFAELYNYINTPERGECELSSFKECSEETKKMYIQMVFDSMLEIPYSEQDCASSSVFNLNNVPVLKIIWQLGLYTAKTPQSLASEDISDRPIDNSKDPVYIIMPPLVAKAIASEHIGKKITELFEHITNELQSNNIFRAAADWLEMIGAKCLQYRLGSGPRKLEPMHDLHTLFPYLKHSKVPNIHVNFAQGEVCCLPKFTTSNWHDLIQLLKPGIYAPLPPRSSSGDFYLVVEDSNNKEKLILIVFKFKSGGVANYTINDIATEAYKCFDCKLLTNPQADKVVSHVVLVVVGGKYSLEQSSYLTHEYAVQIITTDMKNSKDTSKPALSEVEWKRPNNLEIFVLNSIGKKQLLSPYNLQKI